MVEGDSKLTALARRSVIGLFLVVLGLPPGAALAVPPVPCDTGQGACWTPPLQSRWQYQLEARGRRYLSTGGINVDICMRPFSGGACVSPEVYDIDLYVDQNLTGEGNYVVNSAAVDAIHARGRRAICYLSAGDIEAFRPDYADFVAFDAGCNHCLIGRPFSQVFPDEFWANLNNDQGQRDFMLAKIEARVQKCAAAGFDGIEFDVVDAWAQGSAVTGWDISAATQLDYDQRLANLAHVYGLTVALKNDLGQLQDLLPYFDYAINEQCYQYAECTDPAPGYDSWVAAGKAVFTVEYRTSPRRFCAAANAANYNAIRKASNFSLYDKRWRPCR